MHIDEKKLMEAIRSLREALGMSQYEFAAAVDKSHPSIQRYERVRPPEGFELVPFMRLAQQANKPELLRIFMSECEATMPQGAEEYFSSIRAIGETASNSDQIKNHQAPSTKVVPPVPADDPPVNIPNNRNLEYANLTAKLNDMSESLRTIESLIRGNIKSGSASLVQRDRDAGHDSGEPDTDELIAASSAVLNEIKESIDRVGNRLDAIESRETEGEGGRRKEKKSA